MIKNIQLQIEKLQAEQSATGNLLDVMNRHGLPECDSLCWQNSGLMEFSLSYRISDFSEVYPLIKIWQAYILPINLEKGTFTSFRTPAHKQDSHVNTSVSVYPVTCKVSQYGVGFDFYVMVENHLLSINIDFGYNTNFRSVAHVDYRMGGRNQESKYIDRDYGVRLVSNLKGYKFIGWASGGPEYPNDFTMYWPIESTLEEILTLKDY